MTRNTGKGKSNDQPLDDSGLTRQQVMEMGQLASDQLKNPIYNAAHQLIVHEIIEAWASTSPKETNRRESLWHELQAQGKIGQKMFDMVERAKELLQNQETEQISKEQEYLDQQGFGFGDPYQSQNYQ